MGAENVGLQVFFSAFAVQDIESGDQYENMAWEEQIRKSFLAGMPKNFAEAVDDVSFKSLEQFASAAEQALMEAASQKEGSTFDQASDEVERENLVTQALLKNVPEELHGVLAHFTVPELEEIATKAYS